MLIMFSSKTRILSENAYEVFYFIIANMDILFDLQECTVKP